MLRKRKTHRKIDPFEPQPRREDIRGALFWPDTFFVDISAYPDEVQSYDNDDLRVWDEGNLGIFVAAAARTHEQMHWLQLAGTTFGRFLAINRLTTGDLADAIFNTATPDEIKGLCEARKAGVAPAARKRNGRLVHGHAYSGTMQSLFDHWWASVALDHYLTDNGKALLGPIDPRYMVGLGLRYATAARTRDVFNAPDENFVEETIAFGPLDDGREPPIRTDLTVRHIEETAALVEQHLCNMGFSEQLPQEREQEYAARSLAWTLERFMDDEQSLYTQALSHLLEHIPEAAHRRFFELVLLTCDLALNPVIPDDGLPLGCGWIDFHPVCRFERIAASFATFQPELADAEDELPMTWWAEERASLAAHAGVHDGAASGAFCHMGKADADPLADPAGFLRDFLGQAGRNLGELRSRFPASIPSPIHALRQDTDGLVAVLAKQRGPGFDPPLNIKSYGDGEPSRSIDERQYVRALAAVTERRAAHSWLVKASPLNFAGLPSDKTGKMMQDHASLRLREAFGLED